MVRKTQSSTANKKQRQAPGSALYGDVLGIVGSLLRSRQEAAGQKIELLAEAARDFATDLTDIPNVQSYAHAAADQMEALSEYVQDNNIEQIADDATDLARRYPVATIAFAAAAGFGFIRLITHTNVVSNFTTSDAGKSATRSRSTKATSAKKQSATKSTTNGQHSSNERVNAG